MKRRKRVKFVERDALGVMSRRRDGDAGSLATRSHTSSQDDNPKTSEYKSFKRLLEQAGASSHSNASAGRRSRSPSVLRGSHSHESVRRRNTSPPDRTEGPRNARTCNSEDILSVGNVTPVKQLPPLSAVGVLNEKGCLNFEKPQHKTRQTFAGKRRNLIESAASTLSLEVNELLSKGHDAVAMFLGRLGISRESHSFDKLRRTSIMNSDATSQLLTSSKIQNYVREPYESLGINPCSSFAGDIAENSFPRVWRNRADGFSQATGGVEVQLFPVWNKTKKNLPSNTKYSYFLWDSPYLPSRNEVNLDFNSITDEVTDKCRRPVLNSRISTSGWIDQLSSLCGLCEDQPVALRSNYPLEFGVSPGPNGSQLFSRYHQSSLPLLRWNEESNNEECTFVAPGGMETKGKYRLPLTLHCVPQSHDPMGWSTGLGICSEGASFRPFGDIRIAEDKIYPSVDNVLLPSRTKFSEACD